MSTLRHILKYTPAVVLALLVIAWVLSIFREIGFYSTNPSTRGLATIKIGNGEIFFRLDKRLFSNVAFATEMPLRIWSDQFVGDPSVRDPFVGGPIEAKDIFGGFRFIDNAGGPWEEIRSNLGRYAVRIPILLLITAAFPVAIGSFNSFRFRLWHYLAYTALIAFELAYYFRWQDWTA